MPFRQLSKLQEDEAQSIVVINDQSATKVTQSPTHYLAFCHTIYSFIVQLEHTK